jgi:glycosyltransferase involved in cell wall biosynthesis
VEIRNWLVGDDEAVDLFRRCGVVVLPYVEASQSALVAAAYFFRKPAIVTRAGALPEYVVHGETGWVIPPGDPQALAATLAAALGDPDRLARMGRAGWAWYERQRRAEFDALQQMVAALVP